MSVEMGNRAVRTILRLEFDGPTGGKASELAEGGEKDTTERGTYAMAMYRTTPCFPFHPPFAPLPIGITILKGTLC